MLIEPMPGATYGCHDRNLQDVGFQIVIDVVGPTGEMLSSPAGGAPLSGEIGPLARLSRLSV